MEEVVHDGSGKCFNNFELCQRASLICDATRCNAMHNALQTTAKSLCVCLCVLCVCSRCAKNQYLNVTECLPAIWQIDFSRAVIAFIFWLGRKI